MSNLYVTDRLPTGRSATPSWLAIPTSDRTWHAAAMAMLSVRFIQGFVYWGGGSRRFIYAPSKLDPHAPTWMANKFQTAMPGALLGMDHVIAYMLQHFWLLYAGVILFSAAELIAGLLLVVGLFTRAAAFVTVGFSIVLMLMFGWQGATCIDEWTMAACNLAMGATLVLAGSGAYSIDNFLLSRNQDLAQRGWFRWICGALPLPMRDRTFRNLSLLVLVATALFNVATYDHFRGSVYGPFHSGPVSPSKFHYTLRDATVLPDGSVRFHAYLDGGTADVASHLVRIAVLRPNGESAAQWDAAALSRLPKTAIVNDFAYNKFKTAPFGLAAGMGSMATITLSGQKLNPNETGLTLVATEVSGATFKAAIGQNVDAPKGDGA